MLLTQDLKAITKFLLSCL